MAERIFNIINEAYEPEASTNFFDEIEAAIGRIPDYRKVYNQLNQVFKKFLGQQTGGTRINFGGTFGKKWHLKLAWISTFF